MGSIFKAPAKSAPRTSFRRPSFNPVPVKRTKSEQAEPKHNVQREESLQFRCIKYAIKMYPQAIVVTDHAGLDLTKAQRQKMMRMRSEKGHPDISIDYPSRGFHGLRIELKAEGTVIYKKDGTLRKQGYDREYIGKGERIIHYRGDHLEEQAATLKKYNDLGYFARFVVGYDKYVRLLDWYFMNNTTLF